MPRFAERWWEPREQGNTNWVLIPYNRDAAAPERQNGQQPAASGIGHPGVAWPLRVQTARAMLASGEAALKTARCCTQGCCLLARISLIISWTHSRSSAPSTTSYDVSSSGESSGGSGLPRRSGAR